MAQIVQQPLAFGLHLLLGSALASLICFFHISQVTAEKQNCLPGKRSHSHASETSNWMRNAIPGLSTRRRIEPIVPRIAAIQRSDDPSIRNFSPLSATHFGSQRLLPFLLSSFSIIDRCVNSAADSQTRNVTRFVASRMCIPPSMDDISTRA